MATQDGSFSSANGPVASRRAAALTLLALAMGGFTIGTTEFTAMSLLPQLAQGLGIDEPTAGHVISAYALGVVVGAPTIAVFAAKMPKRPVLVSLMAVIALANGLSALAWNYESLLVFRFISGLPHGAFFGVGALVAASLVPANARTRAVSRMMIGLTIATIVGVPLANIVGQKTDWRSGFGLVAILGIATVAMLLRWVPAIPRDLEASWRGELGALRRPQVWLTLAIGAIGFGGLFSVYTYLASTMVHVTGSSPQAIPLALMLFGIGMTLGTIVCAWMADRALMPAAGASLAFSAIALSLYAVAAHHLPALLGVVVLIGCGGGLGSILQTRLMDVSESAQTLPAALNHSAFNVANALGPWLGGIAIASGYGWTSTGWVGVGLACAGLVIWALSLALDRLSRSRSRDADPLLSQFKHGGERR